MRLRSQTNGQPDLQLGAGLGRQGDHGQVRADDLGRAGDQQVQHVLLRESRQQAVGDLGARCQPTLAQAGLRVEPAIVDGHACRHRQGGEHGLVLGVELPATALLGQVEISEDPVPHPDRNSQKAVHRRVVRREPVGGRVLGQVGQTQRLGVADQLTEQAVPRRQRADPPDLLLVQPHRDELRQPLVLPDHAERPVLGVHQLRRRLHDVLQHLGEFEIAPDREHRLQQAVYPVPGPAGSVQPRLQFVQPVSMCIRDRSAAAMTKVVISQ